MSLRRAIPTHMCRQDMMVTKARYDETSQVPELTGHCARRVGYSPAWHSLPLLIADTESSNITSDSRLQRLSVVGE